MEGGTFLQVSVNAASAGAWAPSMYLGPSGGQECTLMKWLRLSPSHMCFLSVDGSELSSGCDSYKLGGVTSRAEACGVRE